MSSPMRSWHAARAAIQALLGLGAAGALLATQVSAPTITSPKSGHKTQELWMTIAGRATPTSAVLLFSDGEYLTRTEADSQGKWSAQAAFTEGEHVVTAHYEKADGSTGEASKPMSLTVSPRQLLAPLKEKIKITSHEPGATVRRGAVLVKGTSAPGRRIEVIVDGKSFKTTAEEDGSWSFNLFLDRGRRDIIFRTAVEPRETVKLTLNVN